MGEMGAVGEKYPTVALGERLRLTRALEQLEAECWWYRCEYTKKKPKWGVTYGTAPHSSSGNQMRVIYMYVDIKKNRGRQRGCAIFFGGGGLKRAEFG